jgi:hypothetical protein
VLYSFCASCIFHLWMNLQVVVYAPFLEPVRHFA